MQQLTLAGIGLRQKHYQAFLAQKQNIAWLEVHSENYFAEGGKPLHVLETLRQTYPISLHGVGLSIGSCDELNWQHLKQLKLLHERIDACLISDHLCWSGIDGQYTHDLLPLPFTQEAIQVCCEHIEQVQNFLKKQILIENITAYIQADGEMSEAEFINEIITRAGCGLLLDVSNIYINSVNNAIDAKQLIRAFNSKHIQEIHLSGFSELILEDKTILIDSHDQAIHPNIWELYEFAIRTHGVKPTLIEWDNHLPELNLLIQQAHHAEQTMRDIYAASKLAS